MEKIKQKILHKVFYNSDPRFIVDNHKSNIIYLLDVDFQCFENIDDAVRFLGECTSPITKIEDLLPDLKKLNKAKPSKFEWLLPESHIRPKHVLLDDLEVKIINQNDNWG